MSFRSFDPVRDAEAHYNALEREYERKRAKMPYCSECGKRIETDTFYIIRDEFFCSDCIDKHELDTDDYLMDL